MSRAMRPVLFCGIGALDAVVDYAARDREAEGKDVLREVEEAIERIQARLSRTPEIDPKGTGQTAAPCQVVAPEA